MPTSLGAHSPKLERVRTLRTKAGRRNEGRYAVEGPTMLDEVLRSGLRPESVYATEAGYAALGPLASRLDTELYLIPDRAMGRLSDLETPPGVLAILPLAFTPLSGLLGAGEPVALLAGVADPGNAGTLLRTAEIFGVTRAIFAQDGVEPYNPKVVRASMGAIFRMQLATSGPGELLEGSGRAGYAVVATARGGTPIEAFPFSRRTILAIGNERRGVAGWLPRWDATVSIEQQGDGESLNAAVAGGIVFYVFSQRAPRGPGRG
jgi:TrmH family RNA methyltransferase